MTRVAVRPPIELDVVGVAVAGALVSGGLSLVSSYLTALPGSLAALALAGWVAQLRRSADRGPLRAPRGTRPALVAFAAGVAVYLFAPGILASFRGLLLGLALLPLWDSARRIPGGFA
jgi:hypothetical protein